MTWRDTHTHTDGHSLSLGCVLYVMSVPFQFLFMCNVLSVWYSNLICSYCVRVLKFHQIFSTGVQFMVHVHRSFPYTTSVFSAGVQNQFTVQLYSMCKAAKWNSFKFVNSINNSLLEQLLRISEVLVLGSVRSSGCHTVCPSVSLAQTWLKLKH